MIVDFKIVPDVKTASYKPIALAYCTIPAFVRTSGELCPDMMTWAKELIESEHIDDKE